MANRWAWVALVLAASAAGCRDTVSTHAPSPDVAKRRAATLAHARVWSPPLVPPERADFSVNTPGPGVLDASADFDCDFLVQPIGGTTPKFYCKPPDGGRVKVKYDSNEVPAQVAASRLLGALGFFADRTMRVRSVRCRGCPPFPAQALKCLQLGGNAGACLEDATPNTVRTFDLAAIERPVEGTPIDGIGDNGWAWFELDTIDANAGGSTRAEVDALRVMAVLIAHWDNKAENQQMVCAPGAPLEAGSCRAPRAALHDLGATFGPLKIDLQSWRRVPMFADARACRVTLASLPYHGGTFPEKQISEEGRRFALGLLRRLSPRQLNTLFEASGVTLFGHAVADAGRPEAWTEAFLAKVEQVASAGPCPSAASLRPERDRN